MTSIDEAWQRGLAWQQAGRWEDALAAFQQVLSLDPRHAGAWHRMGLVALKQRKFDDALRAICEAISCDPAQPAFHANLAEAYRGLRRLPEAEASYRAALKLHPEAASYNNLGSILQAQGRLEDAVDCYQRAISAAADVLPSAGQTDAEQAVGRHRRATELAAHYNLAVALEAQGRHAEAKAELGRTLALDGEYADAHYALGAIQYREGQVAEAETAFRRALAVHPQFGRTWLSLGILCHHQRRNGVAIECYQQALRFGADECVTLTNLANLLGSEEEFVAAAETFRQALACDPQSASNHAGLAMCQRRLGQLETAANSLERALMLDPHHVEAHNCLAAVLLSQGKFAEAWPHHEWRLKNKGADRDYSGPMWTGDPLRGQTILVQAEWGLGDTFQFLRYLPLVQQRGGHPILEVDRTLFPILTESGFGPLLAKGSAAPADCRQRVPLMSLPGIFGTRFETIPTPIPYLRARPKLVQQWAERLRAMGGFKVGIQWAGLSRGGPDRRSMPLVEFAPLAGIPGVTLISLQRQGQLHGLASLGGRFPVVDFDAELDTAHGAFMDTAAIMHSLDLVISTDTSIPHLAGAMGIPVWLALHHAPDWRWFLDRSDSPWYPSMRIFRQRAKGQWSELVGQMAAELAQLVARRAASG